MPKKEINDYIFYKIVCISDDIDLCYVGSTANWKARNHAHKSNCNNENSKNYNNNIYKSIRENGGWSNFKMIEIGKKEQLTKREAEQVEEDYRVELKANMNMKKCFRTEEQRQEQIKEYYQNNKEKRKEQWRKYYQNNKKQHEKYKERQRKYHEDNKDKINERHRKYYEKNKDKINERRREKIKQKNNEYYQKKYREKIKEKILINNKDEVDIY